MDVDEVCRICLQSGEIMSPLFESNVTELDPIRVTDFLKMFTKIHIDQEEGMPDQLCNDCFGEIQRMYSFMLKCEKSETVLKQLRDTRLHLRKLKNVNVYRTNGSGSAVAEGTNSSNQKKENLIASNGNLIIKSISISDRGKQQPSPKLTEKIVVTPDVFVQKESRESCDFEPDVTIDLDDSDDDEDVQQTQNSFVSGVMNGFMFAPRPMGATTTNSGNSKVFILPCPICRRPFRHKKNLKRHIEIVHSPVDLSIQCKVCKRTYRNKDSLRSHMLSMHSSHTTAENGKLKCCVCSRIFDRIQSLKAHFLTHRNYSCRFCLRVFRRPCALQAHLACKKRGSYACTLCPKSFERESCLRGHMMCHEEQNGLECKICSKVFNDQVAYQTHFQSQHQREAVPCNICSEMFPDQNSLDDHVEMEHSEEVSYAEIEMADLVDSQDGIIDDDDDDDVQEITIEEDEICS